MKFSSGKIRDVLIPFFSGLRVSTDTEYGVHLILALYELIELFYGVLQTYPPNKT